MHTESTLLPLPAICCVLNPHPPPPETPASLGCIQAQRLPGLPSSMLGLETILGRDETVDFEDYLDRPADRPQAPRFQVHEAMEIKYGLL